MSPTERRQESWASVDVIQRVTVVEQKLDTVLSDLTELKERFDVAMDEMKALMKGLELNDAVAGEKSKGVNQRLDEHERRIERLEEAMIELMHVNKNVKWFAGVATAVITAETIAFVALLIKVALGI